MYKLSFYPYAGSSKVEFKDFQSVTEAFEFLFDRPNGTLIELKYYPDVDTRKSDRN